MSCARVFRWCLVAAIAGIALPLIMRVEGVPLIAYSAAVCAVSVAILARRYRAVSIAFLLCFFLFLGIFRAFGVDNAEYQKPSYRAVQGANGALITVRTAIMSTIEHSLPYTHAQLLGGILIGAKQSMSRELKDSFNRTGLSHIVAVSGYNITIIIALLHAICASFRMRQRARVALVILSIIAFTILAGGSAATVRASLMGAIAVLATVAGRRARMHALILLAATLMLYINPLLLFDIGFQLSFAAMLGLVYVSPLFDAVFSRYRDWLGMKSVLIQTLGAISTTAPLIAWHFSSFSLIAPLANVIVLPAVPLAMVFGAISTLLSFFGAIILGNTFNAVSPYIWALPWAPLEYIISASSFLSTIPFASLMFPHPIVVHAFALSAYAIIAYALLRVAVRRKSACALS